MVLRSRFAVERGLCDDDCRPLLLSWLFAISAGAAWLALVHLTPPAIALPNVVPAPPVPVAVDPGLGTVIRDATSVPNGAKNTGGAVRHVAPRTIGELAGIFTATMTANTVAEIVRALPGAQPVHANVAPHGGKSALSTSDAGATPGITRLADGSPGRGDLGRVGHAAAVERSAFHATPLPIVSAPALDATVADASVLGSYVRGRVAQLQSCYELAGGTDLAGVVALKITLGGGGAVRAAEIVRRTWSGPSAAEAEACLLRVVRAWRLPSGNEGATITLPISFTRAG